jgi:hypothetical protein
MCYVPEIYSSLGWTRALYKIIRITEFLFSSYFKFRVVDKVQKPSDSECYTPLLGPFRFQIVRLLTVREENVA